MSSMPSPVTSPTAIALVSGLPPGRHVPVLRVANHDAGLAHGAVLHALAHGAGMGHGAGVKGAERGEHGGKTRDKQAGSLRRAGVAAETLRAGL
eukprot:48940-Prymnesium_polylepis.1